MGSSLGPVLAIIFMCDFGEKWGMNNSARPSSLDMLMTLSPYFPIRTPLFNSRLKNI